MSFLKHAPKKPGCKRYKVDLTLLPYSLYSASNLTKKLKITREKLLVIKDVSDISVNYVRLLFGFYIFGVVSSDLFILYSCLSLFM